MYKTFLSAIVALAAFTNAQLSDVPNLSTATLTTASTSTAASTTSAATTSAPSTTAAASVTVITSNGQVFSLSGLPTIAGAGIPTMIVPYTAGAPFMQKSDLPEGTVFIAVGAVLAFLGASVLLWRGLVAWSINRSVKKAALASIRSGTEKPTKNWGGSTGYSAKAGMYQDLGNSVSMEALTSTGKPMKSHFKDHDSGRSTPPPAGLFFSPTAQARNITPQNADRSSSYLPAGYYAQPSSHAAGGARNTIIGGNLPPYARNSAYEPSPPASPALRPSGARQSTSHEHLRAPRSREGMRNTLYSQASNSSLAANIGRPHSPGLGGSRAPSAYLDEMFENHTAMASRDHL